MNFFLFSFFLSNHFSHPYILPKPNLSSENCLNYSSKLMAIYHLDGLMRFFLLLIFREFFTNAFHQPSAYFFSFSKFHRQRQKPILGSQIEWRSMQQQRSHIWTKRSRKDFSPSSKNKGTKFLWHFHVKVVRKSMFWFLNDGWFFWGFHL